MHCRCNSILLECSKRRSKIHCYSFSKFLNFNRITDNTTEASKHDQTHSLTINHFFTTTLIQQTTSEYVGASFRTTLTPTDGDCSTDTKLGGERTAEENAGRVVEERHAQNQCPNTIRHEVVDTTWNVM